MLRCLKSTIVIGLSVGSSSCVYFNKNYSNIVRGPKSSTVHVVNDSMEIRHLISEAEALDARWEPLSLSQFVDRAAHERFATEYMPNRRRLLDAMNQAPGFTVVGGSYCRIIEKSGAQCEAEAAFYSTTYVKVRISTGPAKGKEGWVCKGEVPPAADSS
jgi:hypothetical protein